MNGELNVIGGHGIQCALIFMNSNRTYSRIDSQINFPHNRNKGKEIMIQAANKLETNRIYTIINWCSVRFFSPQINVLLTRGKNEKQSYLLEYNIIKYKIKLWRFLILLLILWHYKIK